MKKQLPPLTLGCIVRIPKTELGTMNDAHGVIYGQDLVSKQFIVRIIDNPNFSTVELYTSEFEVIDGP